MTANTTRGGRRFFAAEVVQTSAMDCGPAALKCLLEGFSIPVSYGRLREACQTDVDGTSIDTIEEAAVQLGLEAEQVMVPVDHLFLPEAAALPAIVVVHLASELHPLRGRLASPRPRRAGDGSGHRATLADLPALPRRGLRAHHAHLQRPGGPGRGRTSSSAPSALGEYGPQQVSGGAGQRRRPGRPGLGSARHPGRHHPHGPRHGARWRAAPWPADWACSRRSTSAPGKRAGYHADHPRGLLDGAPCPARARRRSPTALAWCRARARVWAAPAAPVRAGTGGCRAPGWASAALSRTGSGPRQATASAGARSSCGCSAPTASWPRPRSQRRWPGGWQRRGRGLALPRAV